MDLIKSVTRRSRVSEITYISLNIGYALLLLFLVRSFEPPYLAFLVVALSKWRVFAVRPRFWFVNLQANMIDTIVGLATVTLLWAATGQGAVQFGLTALFAGWLLFVKPRSQRTWVLLQAGIGQFVGLVALFTVAYAVPVFLATAVAWLVAFAAARHVFSSYDKEEERTLLSIIWAFVVAELAWLSYHWTVAYTLSGELKLPQVAIVTAAFGFMAVRFYESYHRHHGEVKMQELRWPFIFSTVLILMLLLRFSGLDTAQL
jgi:hypothetical protein